MRTHRLPVALIALLSMTLLAAADDPPQEYDKLGAFELVRWKEDAAAGPEVELGGIKYECYPAQS